MPLETRGLVTCYVLFINHLSTRSVHIAGVTTAPNGAFMKQVARNLTDVSDGVLFSSNDRNNGLALPPCSLRSPKSDSLSHQTKSNSLFLLG